MPALSSIKRGVDVGQSAHEIAEILEMARTHAIANNRRVEVGFQADAEGLSATVIASRTGETNFVSLMKVRHFPGVRFDQDPADSPVRPEADVQFSNFTGGLSKFTFRGKDFDHVIQFNNRGEACVATNTLHRIIEINLLPNIAGATPASVKANAAVVQISSLSGGVAVYRP